MPVSCDFERISGRSRAPKGVGDPFFGLEELIRACVFLSLSLNRGYYFELELLRGCRSAQVGFLSNQFIIAPKTAGYPGGVGDDDYGWGVDGQHALRWHGGKKLPWDRCGDVESSYVKIRGYHEKKRILMITEGFIRDVMVIMVKV